MLQSGINKKIVRERTKRLKLTQSQYGGYGVAFAENRIPVVQTIVDNCAKLFLATGHLEFW
jgi:hypothetical protein